MDSEKGQVKPVGITSQATTTQKGGGGEEGQPKVILFWTQYYDRADFTFGIGRDPFIKAKCPVNNCIATADRSQLNRSDAVLFHALQFDNHDLPASRNPNQRFIFYIFETIPNTTVGEFNCINGDRLNKCFELLICYRAGIIRCLAWANVCRRIGTRPVTSIGPCRIGGTRIFTWQNRTDR